MVEEADNGPRGLPPPLELEAARALLPAYCAGRLGGEELEAFESFLFERPDFIDELEAFEALREGLQALDENGAALPPAAANEATGGLRRRMSQVASVALVGSLFVNLWLLSDAPGASEEPVGIGAELLLSLRSAEPPRARLAALQGQSLLLRVDLGREAPAAYRISLVGPGGDTVSYPLRRAAEDLLYVVLKEPVQGEYRLLLDQSRQPDDDATWQRFRELTFEVR